jgi:hypothetical protein
MKMRTFGSSSTGDISGFAEWIKDFDEQVSFTVDDGFNFADDSTFRVLHQIEPTEVLDVIDRVIENHGFYDLILAWNKRVLAACPNAVFFPHGNCTWMDPNYKTWLDTGTPKQIETDSSLKKFQVSFLTSDKVQTSGHVLRQEIYDRLPSNINGMPVFKHRSPPRIESKRELLDTYQYIITPQNASEDNWFDDKISDALMAKTIPLYWGCPNISDFFNMDGILHFRTYDELIQMLGTLTPDYYERHYAAVQDNFERALKYVHIWHRAEVEIEKGLARPRISRRIDFDRLKRPRR